ncbi:MAG: hypothetical protein K6G15_01855 [Desulfovibrio sp.]|nr:hypothetical protein [Desulfovibrio sp.]
MLKRLFTCCCFLLLLPASISAFEMPKPNWQIVKDTWNTITGSQQQSASGSQTSETQQAEKTFARVWKSFSEVSAEAIQMATDSEKKSRTFLEFLTAREPKYVRLLKKSQAILADSEAKREFDALDELHLKNKNLQENIIKLKTERVSAPVSSYNPIALTKDRIDQKIVKIEREIAENKLSIEKLESDILEILNKNGLHFSREELQYFVISAEGSELIRLIAIATNMKKIQGVIEKELLNDRNNVGLAKHYTGMYFISLETYLYAHDSVLEKIPQYRQKNREIAKEAQRNRDEALKLRLSATSSELQHITANIQINERVLTVSKLYDELLEKRIASLESSRANVAKKVKIAGNTYRTIVNGSALIALVNSEAGEYSLLMNFEMPELKMIYDTAMLNAFMEIADKIKGE